MKTATKILTLYKTFPLGRLCIVTSQVRERMRVRGISWSHDQADDVIVSLGTKSAHG